MSTAPYRDDATSGPARRAEALATWTAELGQATSQRAVVVARRVRIATCTAAVTSIVLALLAVPVVAAMSGSGDALPAILAAAPIVLTLLVHLLARHLAHAGVARDLAALTRPTNDALADAQRLAATPPLGYLRDRAQRLERSAAGATLALGALVLPLAGSAGALAYLFVPGDAAAALVLVFIGSVWLTCWLPPLMFVLAAVESRRLAARATDALVPLSFLGWAVWTVIVAACAASLALVGGRYGGPTAAAFIAQVALFGLARARARRTLVAERGQLGLG